MPSNPHADPECRMCGGDGKLIRQDADAIRPMHGPCWCTAPQAQIDRLRDRQDVLVRLAANLRNLIGINSQGVKDVMEVVTGDLKKRCGR